MNDIPFQELPHRERLKSAKELEELSPFLDFNSLEPLVMTSGKFSFIPVSTETDYKGIDGIVTDGKNYWKIQFKNRKSEQGEDLLIEIIRFYFRGNTYIHDYGRDMHFSPGWKTAYKTDTGYLRLKREADTEIYHDFTLLKNIKGDLYWYKSNKVKEYTSTLAKNWFSILDTEKSKFEGFLKSGGSRHNVYAQDSRLDLCSGFGVDVKAIIENEYRYIDYEGTNLLWKIGKLICYVPRIILTEGEDYTICKRKGYKNYEFRHINE